MAGVWGCRQDKESFQPDPVSQQALNSLLEATPSAETKTVFTFNNLQQDTILRTAGGVQVYLTNTDQLFVAALNQTLVSCSTCQTLRVEITEVLRKGDMLARKIPTLSADGSFKESIGAVNVEVFCNNERLEILSGKSIKLKIPNNDPSPDFIVHTGKMQGDSLLAWDQTTRAVYEADWLVNGNIQKGYELDAPKIGWVSGLRSLEGSTSTFCLDMPAYFNAVNTQAFLVFKDKVVVIPIAGEDNGENTIFCVDKAVVGFSAYILTVSQLGEEIWFYQKVTEIGGSSQSVQPTKNSSTQVLNFLRSL